MCVVYTNINTHTHTHEFCSSSMSLSCRSLENSDSDNKWNRDNTGNLKCSPASTVRCIMYLTSILYLYTTLLWCQLVVFSARGYIIQKSPKNRKYSCQRLKTDFSPKGFWEIYILYSPLPSREKKRRKRWVWKGRGWLLFYLYSLLWRIPPEETQTKYRFLVFNSVVVNLKQMKEAETNSIIVTNIFQN